ncbi:hypothetical protein BDP27DRAFT_1209195, partial [Rhodocollybia butyracea]
VRSGSIRCDRVIPSGVLTIYEMSSVPVNIPSFGNPFINQNPARALLQALENFVSDSRTDGQFLQLSGIAGAIEVDFAQLEAA